jgi:hypothetical protein
MDRARVNSRRIVAFKEVRRGRGGGRRRRGVNIKEGRSTTSSSATMISRECFFVKRESRAKYQTKFFFCKKVKVKIMLMGFTCIF